jgi:hypothetical protein
VYFQAPSSVKSKDCHENLMHSTCQFSLLVVLFLTLKSFCCCNLNQQSIAVGRDLRRLESNQPVGDDSQSSDIFKMQYNTLLRKLYNINLLNPVKMGLDNANKLYMLLGSPVNDLPIVHVAGTNGKGSVTIKIANCLRLGGVRTGLFVSPHISSFRERIQVNGESMSEDTVVVIGTL